MEFLTAVNRVLSILFLLSYCYQLVYLPVALFFPPKKKKRETPPQPHDYAVLICARNEETVIADLLDSIGSQTYRSGRITPFVLADNCTDRTAKIARSHGAVVYERTDPDRVGKGYALDALLRAIAKDCPDGFDGYFVFDADNLLSPRFVEEMDLTFSEGHDIVTGYRNGKNPTDNWITAGYTLHFLRTCRLLNGARHRLGVSASVNGTGFLFSRRIAERMGGWNYVTLTEDTEFSADMILRGEKIAYCPDAEFFDEQPTSYAQSRRQRLRWAKGYCQVFRRYGGALIGGALRGSFSCFDMAMATLPALLLSSLTFFLNLAAILAGLFSGVGLLSSLASFGKLLLSSYLTLFLLGSVVLASEWKRIRGKPWKKLLMPPAFPLFMITFLPITLEALFRRVEWQPIVHTGARTPEDPSKSEKE